MSQGKENIDKRLQEKLHAAEVTPPASVWDAIESTLDQKQRKAPIMLYSWLGSAAAILLLGLIAVFLIRSERSVEPIENKLAQEVIIDSVLVEKDSVSRKKLEADILEGKSPIAIQSDKLAVAAVEKESLPQVQMDHVVVAQKEEMAVLSSSRENNTVIALNKLSREELASIYKQNANPLIAIKANFLKLILASDNLSNQLAASSARPSRKGWSLGIAYAPTSVDRSSGILTRNADYLYDAVNSEMSFVSEKDLPAYSGGVNLVYQLSERWSFQSGIYYLKQGQRIENFSVVQSSPFYQLSNSSNTTSNSYFGNIVIDNYAVLSDNTQVTNVTEWSNGISSINFDNDLLQQFELIEIPLMANYKIINRKAIFSIVAGINPGILVGNRVYLEDVSERIGRTEAVNTIIYKSVLGVSLEYPLLRKLYFNLSPTFKYQLNNFNKNAIVSEKLKYLEFKTGLNYRF